MHILSVDPCPGGKDVTPVQGGAHHRQVAGRNRGAELQLLAVEQRDQPVAGTHPIPGGHEHLGDPPRERRIHARPLQVEHRVGLPGRGLGELRLDLLAAAVVLPDGEPPLLDREHLTFLVAARLVQVRLRPRLSLHKAARPRHLLADELEKLLLVLQGSEIVPVPQRLLLQVGFEAGHLRVALGEHEPDLAIIEGDQSIAQAHLVPFAHVHRLQVRGHRGGQVRDTGRLHQGEQHEVGRHRSRLDFRHRYRPRLFLDLERLGFGLAPAQRHHPGDAGREDQQRQCDSHNRGRHCRQEAPSVSGVRAGAPHDDAPPRDGSAAHENSMNSPVSPGARSAPRLQRPAHRSAAGSGDLVDIDASRHGFLGRQWESDARRPAPGRDVEGEPGESGPGPPAREGLPATPPPHRAAPAAPSSGPANNAFFAVSSVADIKRGPAACDASRLSLKGT